MVLTCKVEGCEKPNKALRLCSAHYRRFKMYGDWNIVKAESVQYDDERLCIAPNCIERACLKEMCATHYRRFKRLGKFDVRIKKSADLICLIPDCGRKESSKGFCSFHYQEQNIQKWRDEVDNK